MEIPHPQSLRDSPVGHWGAFSPNHLRRYALRARYLQPPVTAWQPQWGTGKGFPETPSVASLHSVDLIVGLQMLGENRQVGTPKCLSLYQLSILNWFEHQLDFCCTIYWYSRCIFQFEFQFWYSKSCRMRSKNKIWNFGNVQNFKFSFFWPILHNISVKCYALISRDL